MEYKTEIKEEFSKYNGEGTSLRKAQLRLLDMMVEFDRICKKHDIPYFISGGTCLGAVRHGGFIPWDDDVDIDVWHTDYKKLAKILPKELPENYFMQTPKTDKGFYRLYMKIVDKNSLVAYTHEFRRKRLKYKGLSLDIFPLENVFSYKLKSLVDQFYAISFKRKRIPEETTQWKRAVYCMIYPCSKLLAKLLSLFSKLAPKERVSHSYGTNMTPELNYSDLFPVKPILFEGKEFLGPANLHEYLSGLYGDYKTIPAEDNREAHTEEIEVFDE
jgi:lipopolysaccharide cholinephosphotransferase